MPDTNIYSLLASAASRNGERTAIEFGGERMTYAELDLAARRMATMLSEYGARPGERVAFCFRKSIQAVVTLFGIARTGAAYVPLDPSWPAERMTAIVSDAGIALWTGSAPPPIGVTGIRAYAVEQGISTGSGKSVLLNSSREMPPMTGAVPACAGGIANILYTSGSTGRPKGVEITTLSLMHFARWGVETFELSPEDRLANHAPYNFDLSTFDIFAAVCAGATMCPVPESLKMFPYQMAKFITDRRISVWYSVPSALVMMQLRGNLREHDLSSLRHVIFAGEVMPKPALKAIAAEIPHATFTNLYGPTETNVCTWHRVMADELARDDSVPIGRAISDTRLWIVDANGRACSARSFGDVECGELWVAGPTVTAGYRGDAVLTQSRLVPAPDGDGFAWRTGDRVRARADGALLFEGRMDRMIKARGHRIEPGEIEAALHRHKSVRQAAVVPIADPVFGNRIKACVALREGAAADEAGLAAHCREHLPAYMLPDVWQFHDSLPQTDRGKVDLQALLASPGFE